MWRAEDLDRNHNLTKITTQGALKSFVSSSWFTCLEYLPKAFYSPCNCPPRACSSPITPETRNAPEQTYTKWWRDGYMPWLPLSLDRQSLKNFVQASASQSPQQVGAVVASGLRINAFCIALPHLSVSYFHSQISGIGVFDERYRMIN